MDDMSCLFCCNSHPCCRFQTVREVCQATKMRSSNIALKWVGSSTDEFIKSQSSAAHLDLSIGLDISKSFWLYNVKLPINTSTASLIVWLATTFLIPSSLLCRCTGIQACCFRLEQKSFHNVSTLQTWRHSPPLSCYMASHDLTLFKHRISAALTLSFLRLCPRLLSVISQCSCAFEKDVRNRFVFNPTRSKTMFTSDLKQGKFCRLQYRCMAKIRCLTKSIANHFSFFLRRFKLVAFYIPN